MISTILIAIFFLFALFSKLPLWQFTQMDWQKYCANYMDCSPKAAEYLIDNNLTDNLLTFYNWGGWLIWNYPQIKPNIDGRMPSWIDDRAYSAFLEYVAYEQNVIDIDDSRFDIVLMSPRKPLFLRLMELTKDNKWKLVYRDQFAGIFVRQKAHSRVEPFLGFNPQRANHPIKFNH